MMKDIGYFIIFLTLAFVILGGCSNTMDGMGQDIERAGEKIQDNF